MYDHQVKPMVAIKLHMLHLKTMMIYLLLYLGVMQKALQLPGLLFFTPSR